MVLKRNRLARISLLYFVDILRSFMAMAPDRSRRGKTDCIGGSARSRDARPSMRHTSQWLRSHTANRSAEICSTVEMQEKCTFCIRGSAAAKTASRLPSFLHCARPHKRFLCRAAEFRKRGLRNAASRYENDIDPWPQSGDQRRNSLAQTTLDSVSQDAVALLFADRNTDAAVSLPAAARRHDHGKQPM